MDNWLDLESAITSCTRCPRLVTWREEVARVRRRAFRDQEYWGKPVPGFGDRNADVLIVGLAPAAHGANRTGRMFTGDSSGDFLYSALHRAGFVNRPSSQHRDDGLLLAGAFISAACRCAPPDNKPTPAELTACRPFLAREMALLGYPRVIVALGRIAFDTVWRVLQRSEATGPSRAAGSDPPSNSRQPPSFGHCAVASLGQDLPAIVASYHPSRQNTQTGRLTVEMFDRVWTQVKQLIAADLAPGVDSR